MAKRFFDTAIWTQNKWFRKLNPKYKLLWFFLFSTCDSVGVWEEDLELASYIIGRDYNCEETLKIFSKQIKIVNGGKKWWLIDFCDFQYGELKEENKNNKPHQSYISSLKKHRLWIDYKKSINRLKEKDKEKDKDMDKEKEKEIIDYLNLKADRKYKYTDKHFSFIKARINEGFKIDDFKKAIDNKCSEWLNTDMDKFLRPETLFGNKMDGYINEKKPKVKLRQYTSPNFKGIAYEREDGFFYLEGKQILTGLERN